MAKKWYTYLTPAKSEKLPPNTVIPPETLKKGRIRRLSDLIFIEFSSIFRSNLLVFAGFLPFIVFAFFLAGKANAMQGSFSYVANTGFQYPLITVSDNVGKVIAFVAELKSNLIYAALLLLIPGPLFAGVFYTSRLTLWGHSGIKVFSVFFEGVKKHWWKYAVVYTVFCALIYGASYYVVSLFGATLTGSAGAGYWVGLVAIVLVLLIAFAYMMNVFAMIPVYSLPFKDILKNSGLLLVGLGLFQIPLALLSSLPVLVILSGSASVIVIVFAAFE
ncbi:MAG: hypothetical protein LBT20_01265, partial [Clostridiales bacterium]|nr:hypothetical protein [Clostridiales bacterium]